jgi:tRNA pseudouridine38-40 synthase
MAYPRPLFHFCRTRVTPLRTSEALTVSNFTMSNDPPHGVLLKIAYDGQNYSGLAVQDNAHTVAGELENAIRTMDPLASRLRVCSRTDAGVHARGQYVAFDTHLNISMRGWLLGLSGVLAKDVAVLSAARIRPRFEPCKNARSKTYRYSVLQGTIRDPFLEGRCWRVFDPLNHGRMREEALSLLGTHDFRAFRGTADFRTNTVRTLTNVSISTRPDQPRLLDIVVEGNAFMYHMVRIISGTLVDVGRGKLAPGAIRRAIASGDRLDLGMTAPAAGLCLDRIELNEHGTDEWPYHLDGAPAEDKPGTESGAVSG